MRLRFDGAQRKAIEGDSDRLVIACPGSGKTRVALGKIIDEGEKQSLQGASVLGIAFAVSAKNELEKRIDASAGPSLRRSITVNTIHGFILSQLIAPFGHLIAHGPLRLAQAGGLAYRDALAETAVLHQISAERLTKLVEYTRRLEDGSAWRKDAAMSADQQLILETFWDTLLESGHVDYANALYVGSLLLDRFTWLREGLAATYPTVVVDEYQDCTDIQLSLLWHLKKGGSRICLVGDPYQCVFQFLGARIASLRDFANEIAAERKPLYGSYRCPQNILDVAERLFPRGIVPVGNAKLVKGDTSIVQTNDTVAALADFIAKCDADGIDRANIAFVTAWNSRLSSLVAELNARGIATTHGSVRRDDADWFALIVDAMLLASPPSTEKDFQHLSQALVDVIGRFAPTVALTRDGVSSLETAMSKVVFDSPVFTNRAVFQLFPEIVSRTMKILDSSNVVRSRDLGVILAELTSASAFYADKDIARESMDERIEELRPSGKVRGYNYLKIKGLEFDAVAVVDLSSKMMPDYKSMDLWDDLRRLYVAVTRSKRHLMIQVPTYGHSRFLPILTGEQRAEGVIGSADPISDF